LLKNYKNYEKLPYDENGEWIALDDKIYFRKSSVFFFPDELRIIGFFIGDITNKTKINAVVKLEEKFKNYKTYERLLECSQKVLLTSPLYNSYIVECPLNIEKLKRFPKHFDLKVYYINKETFFKIKKPLNVQIKLNENRKDDAVLCVRILHAKMDDFENFKQWFEITKYIGYKKIIIYNNTIPKEPFENFLNINRDSIEVRQYTTVPHFNSSNASKSPFIRSFFDLDIKTSDGFIITHDRLALNECYASFIKEYNKVGIMDFDEIIIPNGYADKAIDHKNMLNLLKESNTEHCKYDIVEYLNSIKNDKMLLKDSVSYWFGFSWLIDTEFSTIVFQSLRKTLDKHKKVKSPIEFTAIQPTNNKTYYFSIWNNQDLQYAKDLLEIYDYLFTNNSNANINNFYSDRFSRVFFIQQKEFKRLCYGKSIHDSRIFTVVGHHEMMAYWLRAQVPYQYGYTSHFRRSFNFPTKRFDIHQVRVDINYVNCYLNRINKIISK
jgi:hypothetical protein